MWDDEIEPYLLVDLAGAFARRKRFEARLVAVEVANVLFGSSDGNAGSGRRGNKMPADAFLNEMGAVWA